MSTKIYKDNSRIPLMNSMEHLIGYLGSGLVMSFYSMRGLMFYIGVLTIFFCSFLAHSIAQGYCSIKSLTCYTPHQILQGESQGYILLSYFIGILIISYIRLKIEKTSKLRSTPQPTEDLYTIVIGCLPDNYSFDELKENIEHEYDEISVTEIIMHNGIVEYSGPQCGIIYLSN